jgi:predicted DNA-binding transcriptional regulator AlpA
LPTAANDNQDRPMLRPRDVAQRYGLKESYLQKLRLTGDGPAYLKLSHRTVLYRQETVEAWLSQFEVRSTSELKR